MYNWVNLLPTQKCKETGFVQFYAWCRANSAPSAFELRRLALRAPAEEKAESESPAVEDRRPALLVLRLLPARFEFSALSRVLSFIPFLKLFALMIVLRPLPVPFSPLAMLAKKLFAFLSTLR